MLYSCHLLWQEKWFLSLFWFLFLKRNLQSGTVDFITASPNRRLYFSSLLSSNYTKTELEQVILINSFVKIWGEIRLKTHVCAVWVILWMWTWPLPSVSAWLSVNDLYLAFFGFSVSKTNLCKSTLQIAAVSKTELISLKHRLASPPRFLHFL